MDRLTQITQTTTEEEEHIKRIWNENEMTDREKESLSLKSLQFSESEEKEGSVIFVWALLLRCFERAQYE